MTETDHPTPPLAQIAYHAYAASTGGKTFDGREMPAWGELPPRIQDAWAAATIAVTADLWREAEPLVQKIESAGNRMTGAALVHHQNVVVDGAVEISECCASIWQLLDRSPGG